MSQMVNPNNPEPSSMEALSPFTMEARMNKLEAQVVELSHKMDTQFQSTQEFLERFKVRMQAEFSSLKHELMEALGLNESPPLVPDEELGNPAGDSVKMNLGVEVVDGKLSQTCYLMALDSCYKTLCSKYEKLEGKPFSVADADYFVFHSPYNKLVQKSFARLIFNDFMRNVSYINEADKEKLAPFSSLTGDESYSNRDLEKASQQVSKPFYDAKVQPSTLVPKQVGNMYTASIYAAFISLIHNKHSTLPGQRVVMFSYGSGSTATMFSLRIRECQHPFSLSNIAAVLNIAEKLKSRHEFPPEKFVEILKIMEHRYGAKDFVTSKDCSLLAPGTYYLTEVDSKYRRFYAKKETNAAVANGH